MDRENKSPHEGSTVCETVADLFQSPEFSLHFIIFVKITGCDMRIESWVDVAIVEYKTCHNSDVKIGQGGSDN